VVELRQKRTLGASHHGAREPTIRETGRAVTRLAAACLTHVVAGNGRYSFNLPEEAKDGTLFASREVATAAQRPRLLLEVRPGVG
jgi:hypothetical protein